MNQKPDTDDIRPEYDFSGGVRGKHHKAYREGTNIVVLDPEVARVFRDSDAVNRALRMLIDLADEEVQRNLTKGSGGCS
jgi:hypothetical protein